MIAKVLHLGALDSIFSLDTSQVIAFQGGTRIHLIYGGYRYSEDLDIAGAGINFNLANEIVREQNQL